MKRWPVLSGGFVEALQQGAAITVILVGAAATVVPVMLLLGPDAVGAGIAWLCAALAAGGWASWRATAAITARRAAAGPFVELDGAALRLPGGRSLTLRAGTPVRLGWWSRNTPFPGQPSPEVPAEGAILHVGEGAEALLLWSEDGVIPAKAVDAPRLPAPQGDGVTLRGEDLIAVWRALAAATR